MKLALSKRWSKVLVAWMVMALAWPGTMMVQAAENKAQSKPEVNAETKVEATAETSEAKAETAETKAVPKAETKPESKTETKPVPEIRHQGIAHFQPGRRIHLEAEILDKSGVKLARVYFREKADEEFMHVAMSPVAAKPNVYHAILPAPTSRMSAFEYLIVMVDRDKKIYRSRTYSVPHAPATAPPDPKAPVVFPEWQPESPAAAPPLAVKHELPGKAHIPHGFEPFTLSEVPATERYGMLAGLYSQQAMAGVEHTGGGAYEGQAQSTGGGLSTLSWVGIGAGAAALVAGIAIAAGGGGGGGGGGDSASSTSSTSTTPAVGPNIAGSWSGVLKISGRGIEEPVTARVTHQGTRVTIHTSGSQDIGRNFAGHIDANGNMEVVDQADGQTWTTYYGPASANQLKLADFVDYTRSLNSLKLAR